METTVDGGKLLLTVTEAAAVLGIGRSKIFEMIAREEIPSIKLHGSRRIPVEQLREWIAQQIVPIIDKGGR